VSTHLALLAEDVACIPVDGYVAFVDRYWIVKPAEDESKPGHLMFALMHPNSKFCSPQCHHDERTAMYLRDRLYKNHLVKFFPLVFVDNNGDGYVIDKRMTTQEIAK
jgi:hypothetical protein